MEQKVQSKYSLIGAVAAVLLGALLAWMRVNMLKQGEGATFFYLLMVVAVILLMFLAIYLSRMVFSSGKWMKAKRESAPPPLSGKSNAVYSAIEGVAAALLCLAALLCWWFSRDMMTLVRWIQVAFLLFCGVAKFLETGKKGENKPFWSLFPVLYLGFALLMFYRANTSNAQVSHYAVELFMRIAIMLAIYGICATYFEKARPARVLFYGYLAIFFYTLVGMSFVLFPGYYQGNGITIWSLTADCAFMLTAVCGVLWPLKHEKSEQEKAQEKMEQVLNEAHEAFDEVDKLNIDEVDAN